MALSAFHTVLVVGDNPEELMKKYSTDLKVEKYIKYKRSDAGKLRKQAVKLYKAILDSDREVGVSKDEIKKLYFKYDEMSDFDYYQEITEGCIFTDDSLDAYTDENPNGKFANYNTNFKENKFSLPFILNDGTESYQAKVKDIDWAKVHMNNTFPYERAWEMVVEGETPNNEDEENIYNNMKNHLDYFDNFDSKEEYVRHSCSFWQFAYLDKDGWINLDNTISDKDWVANFYDKLVNTLSDDSLLTIYEYREPYN